MSKLIKTDTYTTLVNDIAELYKRAHQAMVECYWQIGRRIVKQEQRGETSTVYARQLIEQLSEDLQQKLGSGFSERNLYKMRQFYLTHKILPAPAILSWTQHVELLTVTNKADKLSPRQIRQEVRQLKKSQQVLQQDKTPAILPPPGREQSLQCYGLIGPDRMARSRGTVVVDCGFNIWREIRDRQKINGTMWGPSVPPIGSRPIERHHRRSCSTSRMSRLRSDPRWGAIGHSKVQVIFWPGSKTALLG